jgi:hypothetical protein
MGSFIICTRHQIRHRREDGIKMDLRETGWGGGGSGFTWSRIGSVGGLL